MKRERERGALVVEATVSLTLFMFAIFTILSLVNIYFIQARMSVALNSAAKEVSQYSYLYYFFGVDELDKNLSDGTEDSKLTATETIDGVGALMGSLSKAEHSVDSGDFSGLVNAVKSGSESVDSLVTMYADKLSTDPKGFILGMGKLAVSEFKESGVKAVIGQVMAKTFMRKNLMAYKGDDPDAYLKRYNVVDGMAGLDFKYTTLMAYGTSDQIQLCVTYDVRVLRLLNIDFKFTFRQVAKTCAWDNGVSLIQPDQDKAFEEAVKPTIWEEPFVQRGQQIIASEKEKFAYTSNRDFHGFNNANGANEFIKVQSLDATLPSYQTAGAIKNAISNTYSRLETDVTALSNPLTVTSQSGAKVNVDSPKETRTYKIILVVPSNADMNTVRAAIDAFQKENPGVKVELNTSYGPAQATKN